MIEPPLLPRASACTFGPSVCWVAYRLCLGVCLLCTRLSKHLSQFHSVVIVCEGLIRLLFKLLAKFRNALKQAALLVVKISRKTSPQRWRFSFAFKQNDKKLSSTKTFTQRASDFRGRTGYIVKNNFRITCSKQ